MSNPARAVPLDVPPSKAQSQDRQGRVVQPIPQALPSRGQSSAILVNTRQKGNPVISAVRGVPWEWADTPADYVLGATTCALFLSLKYHRLHPEYIYTRISDLKGKFNLRIILTMVDIPNHEESLKELSKTSLINNVTLILCWSAQEAGRYLELFKSYEHAAHTSIKAHQAESYSDRLVEFVTVPRSVNKTDAVSLISTFGSLRTAVNATPDEISLVAGWGGKKVQRWCGHVGEAFRIQKSRSRLLHRDSRATPLSRDASRLEVENDNATDVDAAAAILKVEKGTKLNTDDAITSGPSAESAKVSSTMQTDQNTGVSSAQKASTKINSSKEPELSTGIAAALEKLRKQ